MSNIVYSLNATMPVFVLMILGYFLHKWKLFDTTFAEKSNQFVFKIALPVLLFKNLSEADFYEVWDGRYVLFCFLVSLVGILGSIAISHLYKKEIRGEFAQACYRSSQALLGVAIMQNIYGEAGPVTLMILGAVPLYNVAAVLILTLMKPEQGKLDRPLIHKTAKGILTNPIILGIFLGMLWSILRIPQPIIFSKTVSSVGALATPLGLISLGASFNVKKAADTICPAILASIMKLVISVIVFLPLAYVCGYTGQKLVAILIMVGAPTTVSAYVMANSMGHEGTLSSSVVMITTFFSGFTLTFWLYFLRTMGLI